MTYHFPKEFFHQYSYFSLRIKKICITTAWEFDQNKFILRVLEFGRKLRCLFVTSCHVLNANPDANAYFIAFVIGEHAVLENWFVHLAIYTKTKFYLLISMVLCFSMVTCHDYVLLWLVYKFLWEAGFVSCFDICQIIDWCSPNCS